MATLRRVARNLQWGRGAFLEAGNNSKRSWPRFWSVFNQIEAVFLSNSGDLQKWNKKVFTEIESVFLSKFRWLKIQIYPFSSRNPIRFLTNSRPNPNGGGLFLFFEDKSASKVLKTGYFAYSSGQWGGCCPPWLRYWQHFRGKLLILKCNILKTESI